MLEALRSARGWSRERLKLTAGPLRAVRRPPRPVPTEDEDERWSRVTGHIRALTRALSTAADDGRAPARPDGAALRLYGRLLELIGEACRAESRGKLDPREDARPAGGSEDAMRELHERLQHGLQEHAAHGATRTAVLGALLLQAENLWTEVVPDAAAVLDAEAVPDTETVPAADER
ncbi:hypothetical protein SALBM311S_09914 [Streptomyces alboniger]